MGEVKRYDPINSDGTCGMCIEDADYGAYVEYADYATLEAENAKLRAELEWRAVPDGCLIVPIQPTEEMRKRAQDYLAAEGMIVSDWLVHTAYTEMLPAAPSAPKADDPVKQMLLEALEEILYAEIHSPISMNNAGCIKKMQGIARAAIAAARQEGGKV